MKNFFKGLFAYGDAKDEVKMTQSEIKKKNNMIRQQENNCEENLKMIQEIKYEKFGSVNKLKPYISSEDIRNKKTYMYIQCNKCLSLTKIELQELLTEDEFMKKINVECNKCDEIYEELTNKYNEKIEREEKIIKNIPVGSRVKAYRHNSYSFGTIVEYNIHNKNNVKFSSSGGYNNYHKLDVKDGSYNTVVVMLDRGLECVTYDLGEIEKYDNRLTQSEIEYITSLLERHSIDNYASASIVSMNKEIISKINIDK